MQQLTNLLGRKVKISNSARFDQYRGFKAEIVNVYFSEDNTCSLDVVLNIPFADKHNFHLNGHFVEDIRPHELTF